MSNRQIREGVMGQPDHESRLSEMADINQNQAELYDQQAELRLMQAEAVPNARRHPATSLWQAAKKRFFSVKSGFVDRDYKDLLHREWVGDLSGKRTLDIGCFTGNRFSLELAEKSDYYLGIDLSEKAIAIFNEKISRSGIKNARGMAVDLLSPDFTEVDFDVVHARSVIHHFRHLDVFCRILTEHMAPDGIVVTFDPLQTSLSSRLIRSLYRPFQRDRDWEFPFVRSSFDVLQEYFEIEQIRGQMGKAKWAAPLSFLSRSLAQRLGSRWHEHDQRFATSLSRDLWRCIYVLMKLRRRRDIGSER